MYQNQIRVCNEKEKKKTRSSLLKEKHEYLCQSLFFVPSFSSFFGKRTLTHHAWYNRLARTAQNCAFCSAHTYKCRTKNEEKNTRSATNIHPL